MNAKELCIISNDINRQNAEIYKQIVSMCESAAHCGNKSRSWIYVFNTKDVHWATEYIFLLFSKQPLHYKYLVEQLEAEGFKVTGEIKKGQSNPKAIFKEVETKRFFGFLNRQETVCVGYTETYEYDREFKFTVEWCCNESK